MLKRPNAHCPLYQRELDEVLQSEEVLTELKQKQEILDYLTNHTGKNISTFSNGFGLFQTLTAEKTMNYSLPEWTNSVYPEVIEEMAIRQCELETSTLNLKKLFGGT